MGRCRPSVFSALLSRFLTRLLLLCLLAFAGFICQAADYQIEGNIRYDHYPETVLDIVQPRAPALGTRPGIIVIHGGSWVGGDKENMLERFCLPFVEHDFVVANVEYRLAKAAKAPAAVEDILKAAAWFRDHAAEYKVDPAHIVVTGESAGGELALLAGMLPPSSGFGAVIKIAAVVDFYGILDMAGQLKDQSSGAAAWIPEQPDRMELAKRLSPVGYVRKGLPPILEIRGDSDPVVSYEDSVSFTKALKSAGDVVDLISVPGGQHGFTTDEMAKVWPQVFRWLKKHKLS